MITETYRIADRVIEISSVYEQVHQLCAAYRTDEAARDFSVQTSEADIEYERKKSAQEDALLNTPLRRFSDGYLETLAVYRKIAENMLRFDTFLMHGSCIAVDGQAYLFTAKSGTGKSTHTRLWRARFGDRTIMVNDDKPLIRITKEGAFACGTPWDGKHRLSTDTVVSLRGVCILERAEQNGIRSITRSEAYPMLLQQSYRPADAALLQKTLLLIDRMANAVTLWRLGCNMDPEAAEVSSSAMMHPDNN